MRAILCMTFALLLAGCASQSMYSGQSKYEMGTDAFGGIPQADPGRLVSFQDCTRQITRDGGNLSCM
jgi:hypothetical protein